MNQIVSIIIPTHKRKIEQLQRAVFSAINQSYKNVEIVIVDDNLNKLVDAIKISKFTQKIITENIVLALVAKVAALVIGTIGILGPMAIVLAIFSDVGVCLLAILNAMRILKLKIK